MRRCNTAGCVAQVFGAAYCSVRPISACHLIRRRFNLAGSFGKYSMTEGKRAIRAIRAIRATHSCAPGMYVHASAYIFSPLSPAMENGHH